MSSTNRKNVLLVFGALAIVLVAVFVIWRPPALHNEDVSGAITPVQKHHEAQIQPQDVVLGDEQTKQTQAVVFGDLVNDSAKLQSISAEFGAIAANRDAARITAASKQLSSHQAELQSRYAQYASNFVQAANRLAAKSNDQKLQADVAELGTKLNAQLSDQEALNARLGLLVVIANKLASENLDAAKLSAMMENRAPEAAARLNEAADALQSRQDAAKLSSISAAMQSITMESKLMAQTENKLASQQYASISADLAQSAIELETRGMNNLAQRLNDEAQLGAKLAEIDAQLNAKSANINLASMAGNKADNISMAAQRLNSALASARMDYASRTASMISLGIVITPCCWNQQMDARLGAKLAENKAAFAKSQAAMRELGLRPEVGSRLGAQVESKLNARSN